jgi:hypothetical protein
VEYVPGQVVFKKLARIGYIMIPARGSRAPSALPAEDIEKPAEMEHERWIRARVAAGWRYGQKRGEEAKTNPAA